MVFLLVPNALAHFAKSDKHRFRDFLAIGYMSELLPVRASANLYVPTPSPHQAPRVAPARGNSGRRAGRLYSRREVAEMGSMCQHTVARATRDGRLPCVRFSARLIRYREEDVLRFLSEGRVS